MKFNLSFMMVCAGFVAVACGDKKEEPQKVVEKISEKSADVVVDAGPACTEKDEDTARVIQVDNKHIGQFCRGRVWGNKDREATTFKCRNIGFIPTVTDDKMGITCRSSDGVVSLNTQWLPHGVGLELCNPEERNTWFRAYDAEGVQIAIRCSYMGYLDGSETKSRFLCEDPDKSFKTTISEDRKSVACVNDQGVYSMIMRDQESYLTNSNCPVAGKWELFKDRSLEFKAGKCDAGESPAPGRFINLTSPSSTFSCLAGQKVVISADRSSVTCE